ncbi:MAG TPA: metal-dependent hydrolase [Rhizomicrobium sp.]|nr:metal-dependent hydrolase [Rhizomicrobium sp.]
MNLTDMPAIWSRIPEVALTMNAGGAVATVVEPYLNQVMNRAARELGDRNARLKNDIDIFVLQETQHYRLHGEYDEIMYRNGYELLKPLQLRFQREYAEMLRSRPLLFNLAYCVGFETATLYTCNYIFGPGDVWFEGGDPRGRDLWRWHMAEEYEHRGVCHETFTALGGDYGLRMRGYFYSLGHLGKVRKHLVQVVLQHYRETLSESERRESIRRERRMRRHMVRQVLTGGVLNVLVPGYDPMKRKPAPGVVEALTGYPAAV